MSTTSRRRRQPDPAETAEAILAGNRRALARGLSIVERGGAWTDLLIQGLYAQTGQAHVVGITGPPGAGKSTLVNALAKEFRALNRTVAILAVDPSSPYTGGALLGDRIRMNELYADKGIFIRSLASRGQLGGLASATADMSKVFDAAGYNVVLIETVGAGQAEVDIADVAHTTIVVEAPGLGDDIQSIKAGILEIADILVLNKADRPGARNARRALSTMLQLGRSTRSSHHGTVMQVKAHSFEEPDWDVQIVETVATSGEGLETLVATIYDHEAYISEASSAEKFQQQRSVSEIEKQLISLLRQQFRIAIDSRQCDDLLNAVNKRQQTPKQAAEIIFQQFMD